MNFSNYSLIYSVPRRSGKTTYFNELTKNNNVLGLNGIRSNYSGKSNIRNILQRYAFLGLSLKEYNTIIIDDVDNIIDINNVFRNNIGTKRFDIAILLGTHMSKYYVMNSDVSMIPHPAVDHISISDNGNSLFITKMEKIENSIFNEYIKWKLK